MKISRFKVIPAIFPRKELQNGNIDGNAFSLKDLHRYTKRSVKKFVCLHVLLVGIVVSLGINSKEELQKIDGWWLVEGTEWYYYFFCKMGVRPLFLTISLCSNSPYF